MWPLLLCSLPLWLGAPGALSVCSGGFRSDFVLDTESAVKHGAVMLTTAQVDDREQCESLCCADAVCNLALMEPTGNCTLFTCVYKNRFVCDRLVPRSDYQTYVTEPLYRTYLKAPPRTGEQRRPIAVGGRDLVVQPGEAVVLNGIESHSLADQILDYSWTQIRGNSTVIMEKTEFPDQVWVSGLDSGSYQFQLTVTDSNGNTASDQIQVLVLTPEQSSLFCLAPAKVGPCRASFTRWRYDAVGGACVNFTYGGCKGNYNNYLSKEACVTACRGVTTSARSVPPPNSGVCGSPCSPGSLVCDSDCCLHHSLECDGVAQCRDGTDELNCGKVNQTFNRLVNIELDEKKARCSLPPHTGPCRARFPRWFYDPLQQKCQSFTYGGCDANENNHETEEECLQGCTGVTEEDVYSPGMFRRFGEEDESESGSIALAVVLTVALLALLAVATYCFLRKKKNQGQRAVATTEQD